MSIARMLLSDLAEALARGVAHESATAAVSSPLVIVDCDGATATDVATVARAARSLPCVLAAGEHDAHLLTPAVDVVLADGDLDAVIATVSKAPITSVAFALLLRGHDDRARSRAAIDDGLVAESTTYSMLQAGPEFAAWRAARRHSIPTHFDEGDAVLVAREGVVLDITLNRPRRHNAVDVDLRDGLAAALSIGLADDGIERVVLRGNGPSFCSGGDLNTFGTFDDPASAHVVRLTRSPARLMARLATKIEVRLHGSCLGAGIELPAFGRHVTADESTSIGLPEVGLGLVPGAGGTVSLPNRIGRHRTAWLGLTGRRIDAATARAWHLVDEIVS